MCQDLLQVLSLSVVLNDAHDQSHEIVGFLWKLAPAAWDSIIFQVGEYLLDGGLCPSVQLESKQTQGHQIWYEIAVSLIESWIISTESLILIAFLGTKFGASRKIIDFDEQLIADFDTVDIFGNNSPMQHIKLSNVSDKSQNLPNDGRDSRSIKNIRIKQTFQIVGLF